MRPIPFAALVCLTAIGASEAQGAGTRYTLDPSNSRVQIHVGKAGLLKFAGHEHTVVAPLDKGSAVVDSSDLSASSVDLTFAAKSLKVTGAGEPAEDVPKVQETMVGPECLDAAHDPEIRFVSTQVGASSGKSGRSVVIKGRLTLHGVSREVTVPAQFDTKGDTLTASGTFRIKQTDFEIKPISKAGVVKVKDELTLDFHLQGRKSASP